MGNLGLASALLGLSLAAVVNAPADSVNTSDGARLLGTITKIDGGIIYLDTSYAGGLEIKQSEVVGFTSDQSIFVRLHSGTTMAGPVEYSEDRGLQISSADGTMTTEVTNVVASWPSGSEDPNIVRLREAAEDTKRKWKYEVAFDYTAKKGNSDENGVSTRMNATLASDKDTLKFYTSLDRAETKGKKSANEIKGGVNYTSFFADKLGWFARVELENDEFEDLDLRTTTAAGLSYKFWHSDTRFLHSRVGFSYLFESFSDGRNAASPGIDLGLSHMLQLKKLGKLSTEVGYIPRFKDFGDFRLSHDTGLDMPLGLSTFSKLRLGMSNFYNSNPSPGRNKLDTTYYTRLIFNWN